MKIKYNTLVYEFENYDELDDYILVDKNYESLHLVLPFYLWFEFTVFKVWKSGKITNKYNKEFKIRTNINDLDPQKNYKYWICKGLHKVKIKDLIWDIYSNKYPLKKSLLLHHDNTFLNSRKSGLFYRDNDFNNLRLDNLLKYELTNEGTEIYDNKNNYFDFHFEIERDSDDILVLNEPIILNELPDLEVYSNGNIIDKRGKSVILSNKNGYNTISYKSKNYLIHRLVGECYLRKKDGCNIINHIDGDRKNNDVKNLEWVNNTINTLHGRLSIKLKNVIDLNKYVNRSSGVKGWISLTSKGYRDFVKKKIIDESKMDVECWIFSHKTPLFLLYIPFSKNFGMKPDLNSWYYKMFQPYHHQINNEILFNKFFGKENLRYNELFKGKLKYSKKTYSVIVDCINNYIIPKNSDDHLLNTLFKLGINFDVYFNWLFDDLKIFVGDDVGFIFFEEIKEYIDLLRIGDTIFVNDFLNRPKKFNTLDEIKEEGKRVIYFDTHFHRIIEDIPSNFGRKFINDTTKYEIKDYYHSLFFWDQNYK